MNVRKLTLHCPAALGEQVTDFLLEQRVPDGSFISFPARGHGRDFTAASPGEQVRGHVETMVIVALLPDARLEPLLDMLRARFPSPRIAYWIEPVDASGDFA